MNKKAKKLLEDFDNLYQALTEAKYYYIAEILKALKQVFIEDIQ